MRGPEDEVGGELHHLERLGEAAEEDDQKSDCFAKASVAGDQGGQFIIKKLYLKRLW